MKTVHSDSQESLLVNGSSRAVRCVGLFGARLRQGNIQNGAAGMGDSILIDPAKGLFAVGDSSDREPSAARMFMRHFSSVLTDVSVLSPDAVIADSRLDSLQTDLVSRTREMLQAFPFQGTTTFTGVLLLRTERRTRAVLFHTGDSVLLAYHPLAGMRRITENNFWLLGKVREFYQVRFFDVYPGQRFLFATDGLQDLSPPGEEGFDEYLAAVFGCHPVEEIPDILIDRCDTRTDVRDDIALLSLAPDRPFPKGREILLGGTTAVEEAQRRLRTRELEDKYVVWELSSDKVDV